jgi:hypothetical protein
VRTEEPQSGFKHCNVCLALGEDHDWRVDGSSRAHSTEAGCANSGSNMATARMGPAAHPRAAGPALACRQAAQPPVVAG